MDYEWSGLREHAFEFEDEERAEAVGLIYADSEFTVEKIIE